MAKAARPVLERHRSLLPSLEVRSAARPIDRALPPAFSHPCGHEGSDSITKKTLTPEEIAERARRLFGGAGGQERT
jgi:hypothetical protein